MKNNIISSAQFYFSAFLSSFATLLFINENSSYFQIVYVVVSLVINYLIIKYVELEMNKVLNIIFLLYFFLISVLVLSKFVEYMHSAIKSGPYWSLLMIMFVTILFSSRKGYEAFARASIIIGFFSVFFIAYVVIATAMKIKATSFDFKYTDELLTGLILIFPSVVYLKNNNKISENKISHLFAYIISTTLFIGYNIFISAPINKKFPLHYLGKISHIGVFKGGEFLFLVLITIGVVFFLLLSVESVAKGCNHILGIFYWIAVTLMSGFSLYFRQFDNILNGQVLQIIIFIVVVSAIILSAIIYKYKIHKKIRE